MEPSLTPEGESIIGATILEKGTNNGTVSDLDGNFKLKVAAGKKLVISYIGYETQEVVAKSNMNIVMKDNAKELSEVVVTGYQVQRKADLTGAVAVMDMKSVKSESDPNMLNSMQGKLPVLWQLHQAERSDGEHLLSPLYRSYQHHI